MANVCEHCDSSIVDGAVVCVHCGSARDEPQPRPEAAPFTATPEVTDPFAELPAPPPPPPMFSFGSDLNGIGGWLILPCIGLAVSPFTFMHGIYTDLHVMFGNYFQSALTARPALAALIMFEAVNNSVLFATAIFLNMLLYRKKKSFPTLMVIYLAANLALGLTDHLFAVRFFPGSSWAGIARGFVGAAIWIPYFLQSQRVKETFVN
jgi:Protein of unknown function (DUF2569)